MFEITSCCELRGSYKYSRVQAGVSPRDPEPNPTRSLWVLWHGNCIGKNGEGSPSNRLAWSLHAYTLAQSLHSNMLAQFLHTYILAWSLHTDTLAWSLHGQYSENTGKGSKKAWQPLKVPVWWPIQYQQQGCCRLDSLKTYMLWCACTCRI